MMKIKITDFAKRHFESEFGGTKILNKTKEEVEKEINLPYVENAMSKFIGKHFSANMSDNIKVHDGYAPFCKLVAIPNFTDASVGSMPITLENYPFIRSGYSARRESELPVFSRWLEIPLDKPKAEYLMFVLYDKAQIDKEAKVEWDKLTSEERWDNRWDKPKPFEADWGVVAILGQSHSGEEPMKPETMLRNALGTEEGGSGVVLDREAYMKSVEFWDKNITVK